MQEQREMSLPVACARELLLAQPWHTKGCSQVGKVLNIPLPPKVMGKTQVRARGWWCGLGIGQAGLQLPPFPVWFPRSGGCSPFQWHK